MNRRLTSIDALRGIGALMVLFYHVTHHAKDNSQINTRFLLMLPLDFGYLGVPLFLVVSGFCIHLTAAKNIGREGERGFSWKSFWKRRFRRLYPPYFVTIFYSLLLSYLTRTLSFSFLDLFLHLFMLHNLFAVYVFGVGNPALWSLGLEEQLYALYAAYLWMRRRWKVVVVISMTLAITLGWIYAVSGPQVLSPGQTSRWSFITWPFNYWCFWILGAIAAEAYQGTCRLPGWCYKLRTALLLIFFGIMINGNTLGRINEGHLITSLDPSGKLSAVMKSVTLLSDPLFAVAFFVLVNYGVRRETLGALKSLPVKLLATVGIMSYSLYLTHQPLVILLEKKFNLNTSLPLVGLRYALFVPIALFVSWAFYMLIERRFLNSKPRSAATEAVFPAMKVQVES
ncbi:MAG TPA: acyltransferase [Pyrinomonadaceae bacterium]|jgi:peptidoglycan/LPS O-acetylase OafA/YrhL